MRTRLRPPDVTFVAAVALVAIVQVHYWEIAPRFGGVRETEDLFRALTSTLLRTIGPTNWGVEPRDYAYNDLLTNLLVTLLFALPALAVCLTGRTRRPRLTIFTLRAAALIYVAWILVLSPKISLFMKH